MEINVNKTVPKNRNVNIDNKLVPQDDKFNISIMDENTYCDDNFYIEISDKQFECYIKFNDENTSLDALSNIGIGVDTNSNKQYNEDEFDSSDIQSITLKKDIEIGNNGKLTISSDIVNEETNSENLKIKYQQPVILNDKFQISPYSSTEIEYKEKVIDEEKTSTDVNANLETGINTTITPNDNLSLDVFAGMKFTVPFVQNTNPEFNSVNSNIKLQYNPKPDLHIGLNGQTTISDLENNSKNIGLNIKQDNIWGNSANLKVSYLDSIETENEIKTVSRSLTFSGDLIRQLDKNSTFKLSGQYEMTQENTAYMGEVLSDLTTHSLRTNVSLNKQLRESNSVVLEAGYSMDMSRIDENNLISQSIRAKAEIENGNKTFSYELYIPMDNPQKFSNTLGCKLKF